MNALQTFLADNPALQTAVDILGVTLPSALLFAFAGMGFMSATALILAGTRERASFGKCARQLALLGTVLGWILLVGGRLWLFFTQKGYTPDSLPGFLTEISWILLAVAALMSSLYYALWKGLANLPILHLTLGMLSGIQGCIAAAAALASARILTALSLPNAAALTPQQVFLPEWGAPLWSALCYSIPLLFALPAGFGAVWLILRRKYDDFGRDHYNTMIPWCAAWARNAWGLLWLLLLVSTATRVYSDAQAATLTMQDGIEQGLRLLLWLIPVLLWTAAARSSAPLRHKFSLAAALLVALSFMVPFYLEAVSF